MNDRAQVSPNPMIPLFFGIGAYVAIIAISVEVAGLVDASPSIAAAVAVILTVVILRGFDRVVERYAINDEP